MKVSLKDSSEQSQIPAHQHQPYKKPAYFELRNYPSDGICERLSNMLIRPPRFVYNPDLLTPNRRNRERFTAQTVDIGFELTIYRQKQMRYILLYLHGNGSSRFEGCLFLSSLPDKVGLACFDFNGCGNREESDFITLGQNESKDVDRAAVYLKELGYLVVGWGRSMGAVSLLNSSECDIMVSDSAYCNLTQLCKQSSTKFLPKACCCMVQLCFPCVFCWIKAKVFNKSGLKIEEMDTERKMVELSRYKKSICFIHGEEDTLIPCQHSQKLYDAFNGHKMFILFEGTHNSSRPEEVIEKCFQFIEQSLEARRSQSPVYFAPSNKLSNIIEMEEMHRDFMNTENSQLKKFNSSKDLVKVAAKGSKEHVHLQSSYSNGPSKISEITPETHEQYVQNGLKVDMQLVQQNSPGSKPGSFVKVAKDSDFHLFPTYEGNQNAERQYSKQAAVEQMLKNNL